MHITSELYKYTTGEQDIISLPTAVNVHIGTHIPTTTHAFYMR